VWKAPGIKNKFLYIVMPPGWSHTGDHKTARLIRREFLKKEKEPVNTPSIILENELM